MPRKLEKATEPPNPTRLHKTTFTIQPNTTSLSTLSMLVDGIGCPKSPILPPLPPNPHLRPAPPNLPRCFVHIYSSQSVFDGSGCSKSPSPPLPSPHTTTLTIQPHPTSLSVLSISIVANRCLMLEFGRNPPPLSPHTTTLTIQPHSTSLTALSISIIANWCLMIEVARLHWPQTNCVSPGHLKVFCDCYCNNEQE